MENPARYIEHQEKKLKARLESIYYSLGIQEFVDEFTTTTGLPIYEVTFCFDELNEVGKCDVKSIFKNVDVFRASV
jgi:hypothetical protein